MKCPQNVIFRPAKKKLIFELTRVGVNNGLNVGSIKKMYLICLKVDIM